MITTSVTCTSCNEPRDIIGDSIQLPFICGDCQDAQETVVTDPPFEATEADVEPEAEYPSHETATVENTTLLIQDLEQQLADAKEAASKAEARVSILEACNDQQRQNIEQLQDELAATLITTTALMAEAERQLERAHEYEIGSYMSLALRLKEIDHLKEEFAKLDARLAEVFEEKVQTERVARSLRSTVHELEGRVRRRDDMNYELRGENTVLKNDIRALKGRSLWSRIRNK